MEQFGARLGAQAVYAAAGAVRDCRRSPLSSVLETVTLPLNVLTPEQVEAEYVREMAALQPDSPFYEHAAAAYADWRHDTLGAPGRRDPTHRHAGRCPRRAHRPGRVGRGGRRGVLPAGGGPRAETGPRTYVVGYANGDIGYLPPQEIYAEGGYEVDMAYKFYGHFMVAAGGFEQVRRRALALLA